MNEQMEATGPEDVTDSEDPEDEVAAAGPEMPMGIVLARILVVTAMSFSAAVTIFCIVGALWLIAALAAAMTVVFLFLMFGVERLAEH